MVYATQLASFVSGLVHHNIYCGISRSCGTNILFLQLKGQPPSCTNNL